MVRPVSSASCCSDHFQSRRREPLEPPPSAVIRITRPADPIEPEPNAVDGELPGIIVDSKADVAVVGANVIDPVGDDFAQFLVLEIVGVDLVRPALRAIVAGAVL